VANLCRNNEGGQPCGAGAAAGLAIRVGAHFQPCEIDLCLSHLLAVMIRNGTSTQEAVDVITAIGHRIALDILDQEKETERSEDRNDSGHGRY